MEKSSSGISGMSSVSGPSSRSGRGAFFFTGRGSASSGRSTRSQLEKLAEKHSFRLSGKEFCCKGAFHFLAKGRPDADDLKAAAAFAVAVTM